MTVRRPALQSRAVCIAALVVPAAWAGPAGEQGLAERRQQLTQARNHIEQVHEAAVAACERQFAVNACVERAQQARRQALAPVRQEDLALADAERQAKAMARSQANLQRQQAMVQRRTSELPASAPVRATRVVDGAAHTSAHATDPTSAFNEPVAGAPHRSAPSAEATVQALQRVSAAEQRRQQAAQDRARIAARQAARARDGASAAAGLPVPQQAFQP